MVIVKNEVKLYDDFDDFICDENYYKTFMDVYGFTPSNTNLKRKIRTKGISDIEMIEKVLDSLPDRYIVGSYGTNREYWDGGSYGLMSTNVIWVHKLGESDE